MILAGENRRTQRKTCPSATLSARNPTWTDPATNLDLCSERPVTNHLSHDIAYINILNRNLHGRVKILVKTFELKFGIPSVK
jgi:hypothetical protein